MLSMVGSHCFRLVSCPVPNAGQVMVAPFGSQGTLLAHPELTWSQNPQIPFCRAALQPLVPQSMWTTRITLSQVQNPASALVKLRTVGDCQVLPSIEVSLQGLPTLKGISKSS